MGETRDVDDLVGVVVADGRLNDERKSDAAQDLRAPHRVVPRPFHTAEAIVGGGVQGVQRQ